MATFYSSVRVGVRVGVVGAGAAVGVGVAVGVRVATGAAVGVMSAQVLGNSASYACLLVGDTYETHKIRVHPNPFFQPKPDP